eukprot:Phypoly_transcript_03611.p1 GENE.Phypoly_transcript_03611~~Phypoly_transcript_03611.p1  ORF type:complete len:481 (+),score=41.87 Phypoly_transcript_03611:751-2193(+)
MEIVHLSTGALLCTLPDAALDFLGADIAMDASGDFSIALCNIDNNRIRINIYLLVRNATTGEYMCILSGRTEPRNNGDKFLTVTLQPAIVILTLTNGTMIFFTLENMEIFLVYKLFNPIAVRNSHITEDLRIWVGTNDGTVWRNQSAEELEDFNEPPTLTIQSQDTFRSQIINYTIQQTHNLYRKLYNCVTLSGFKNVLTEFLELREWKTNIYWRFTFLRDSKFMLHSKFVREGFKLFEDLMNLDEFGNLNATKNIYIVDTIKLGKLSVFPASFPLCKIKSKIETKLNHKHITSTVNQILQSCRNPTSVLSLSDIHGKIAFVQEKFHSNALERQAVLDELLSVEDNLYQRLAQKLAKETAENSFNVFGCSRALQKDFLDNLFRLISSRNFAHIQPTMENSLKNFLELLEQALADLPKQNHEIAQKCIERLNGKVIHPPERVQDNMDLLGRKYLEALDRCKYNAKAPLVSTWEEDEEEEKN